jgi:hypothetical protein
MTSTHSHLLIGQETIMNHLTGLTLTLALTLASGSAAAETQFTSQFPLGSCQFASTGGNPYFPIIPGRQAYYSNSACVAAGKCDELNELWITMLPELRRITLEIGGKPATVFARVMEERETEDGELVEISRNFVVDCRPARDVYYFGEDVDIYEDGQVVDHEGEWLAGRNGGRPGMLMPEDGFLLGSRYYQEVVPGVALDQAEHIRTGFSMRVPAGRFDFCTEVRETTPLEPDDISTKVYCRGVGLVRDDKLELTAIYGDPH